MAFRYRVRSACARVARTAGPFEPFNIRNWIPDSSVAIAIAPPSASTSLTKCPLPIPPIDGLQDICPNVSILWVRSNVVAPLRAAASAASVPAWPPPTTITSKTVGGVISPIDHGTWKGTHYSRIDDDSTAFHVKHYCSMLMLIRPVQCLT